MEEERKLYPFTFCTIQDDYSWGTDCFKLADLGYRDSLIREGWLAGNSMSEVMDTYIERVVGEKIYNFYGRQFPICVKDIQVRGRMPLRVHPDDETAADRYDFLGKEKMWYVLSAGRNAKLKIGFKKDTDATELYNRCLDNTADELLNIIAPHAGQSFHIAPGTPHAAEGDLHIIEISESSPLDFCLCGWGEPVSEEEFDPQLSLIEALDFINYRKYVSKGSDSLPDIPQLRIARLDLKGTFKADKEDAFALYTCVSGEAVVTIPVLNTSAEYRIRCGETLLIPAECTEYTLSPAAAGTTVLVTGTDAFQSDAYINPDAAPRLDEEYDDGDDVDQDDLLI